MSRTISAWADRGLGGLVAVALMIAWEVSTRTGVLHPVFVPGPVTVISALAALLQDRDVLMEIAVTLRRFLSGYFLGCSLAIPVGVVMGISRIVYSALDVTIELLRPIPASALIPVGILVFGLGDSMVVAIVCYAVLWPVLINTIDGVREVDPILLDTGRMFGYSNSEIVRKVIIPATLPYIATGMRISLAVSLVLVIVVEMLVGDQGLGHRIITAERTFKFPEMYALVVLIGLIGYGVNLTFMAVRARVIGWHISQRNLER